MMIRILFIDDNIERTQEIASWLGEYQIENDSEFAVTKDDALRKLSCNQYDLVIVDIVLPESIKTIGVSQSAGLDIVKEICFSRTVIRPLYLLGITSNQESYDAVKNEFESSFIPLSIWEIGDENWKTKLIAKIKYLSKLTNEYKPINKNKVDVAIITAVGDEYHALDTLPICWKDVKIPCDPLIYSRGILTSGKTILRVKLPEMGMSAASHVTTRIIELFEPKSVVMTGICGGNKDEVALGDVVVAERTWDYGSGKIKKGEDGKITFFALPNQIVIDAILQSDIERNSKIINKICGEWNTMKNDDKCSSIKIGAITTGSAVVANRDVIDAIIEPQYRKVLGIDMETYGVYFACEKSGKNIKFVSMKAVSDLADVEKDDSYHKFCSYVSAKFAFELIELDIL